MAVDTANGHDEIVVSAQSMAASGSPPAGPVVLNAMIPAPGETAADWWANTGSEQARRAAARDGGYPEEFDLQTYFLHDLPPGVLAEGPERQRDEAEIAFEERCPLTRWQELPTTVLAGREDRFFAFAFQERVARESLGTEAQPVPGGHLAALRRAGRGHPCPANRRIVLPNFGGDCNGLRQTAAPAPQCRKLI